MLRAGDPVHIIRTFPECLVEQSNPVEYLAAIEQCLGNQRNELGVRRLHAKIGRPRNTPCMQEMAQVAAADRRAGVCQQPARLLFELVLRPEIVASHEGDQGVCDLRDAEVFGNRESITPVIKVAHAIAETFRNGRGVVRGGAVHDDQLDADSRLGQHAFNGGAQKLSAVVNRHDHADRWLLLLHHFCKVCDCRLRRCIAWCSTVRNFLSVWPMSRVALPGCRRW